MKIDFGANLLDFAQKLQLQETGDVAGQLCTNIVQSWCFLMLFPSNSVYFKYLPFKRLP